MFGNIGWGEMVVIVIAGLVILGPERLPGAMSWLARSLKQVRAYATGAQTQLRDELGPEFEDLRKPLSELQELRGMSPRAAITKHLLDGDDSLFTGEFDRTEGRGGSQAGTGAPPDGDARAAGQGDGGGRTPGAQASSAGGQQDPTPQQWNGPGAASQQQSDTSAIKPVFDEDAT